VTTTAGAPVLSLRNLVATVTVVGAARSTVLWSVRVVNNSAAACFVQFFNASAATGVTLGTTRPDDEFQVAANSTATFLMGIQGAYYPLGCFAASTTLHEGSVASATGVCVYVQAT
jgi:hypothetical protein